MDKALQAVMTGIMRDDAQLFKHFMGQSGFLGDFVSAASFDLAYKGKADGNEYPSTWTTVAGRIQEALLLDPTYLVQ